MVKQTTTQIKLLSQLKIQQKTATSPGSTSLLIDALFWHTAKRKVGQTQFRLVIRIDDYTYQAFLSPAVLTMHPVYFTITKLLCVVL